MEKPRECDMDLRVDKLYECLVLLNLRELLVPRCSVPLLLQSAAWNAVLGRLKSAQFRSVVLSHLGVETYASHSNVALSAAPGGNGSWQLVQSNARQTDFL